MCLPWNHTSLWVCLLRPWCVWCCAAWIQKAWISKKWKWPGRTARTMLLQIPFGPLLWRPNRQLSLLNQSPLWKRITSLWWPCNVRVKHSQVGTLRRQGRQRAQQDCCSSCWIVYHCLEVQPLQKFHWFGDPRYSRTVETIRGRLDRGVKMHKDATCPRWITVLNESYGPKTGRGEVEMRKIWKKWLRGVWHLGSVDSLSWCFSDVFRGWNRWKDMKGMPFLQLPEDS